MPQAMKKTVAVTFSLCLAAIATCVMLLCLYTVGAMGAFILTAPAVLLTAETIYDVLRGAWKPEAHR